MKAKAHQKRQEALESGANMLHWAVHDGADHLAKEGALQHNLPAQYLWATKRRAKVAVIIQTMLLAIMKEGSPSLDHWFQENPGHTSR